MKKINRLELLRCLELTKPGISQREIVEQSSCFIFKGKKIITFNDEIACSYPSPLDIKGAVQSAPLISVLQKMSQDDELDVEATKTELRINGVKRYAGIRLEKEILIPIDTLESPENWTKLPKDFSEALKIVKECAGKDETQFAMTCIHLHSDFIEACDNYQIIRYKIKTRIAKDILVRKDSLSHVAELDATEFSETKHWIHFRSPSGLIISCRRYREEFPDMSKILKASGTPTILPKGLMQAAERAEIFSIENAEDNQVTISLVQNKIKVTGKGASGWYKEIKKIKYNGDDIIFTISPKLLVEIVKRHNECLISPTRLKVEDGKFTYVTCLGKSEKESKSE
jgi:hypothetical protein